jgi:hypothetical protein
VLSSSSLHEYDDRSNGSNRRENVRNDNEFTLLFLKMSLSLSLSHFVRFLDSLNNNSHLFFMSIKYISSYSEFQF